MKKLILKGSFPSDHPSELVDLSLKNDNLKLWNLVRETNPKYITYKSDPGDKFLVDVRKLITDLNLKSKP